MSQITTDTEAARIAAGLTRAQREAFDSGVVHGQTPWHSDTASRFLCTQYKPDPGEEQRINFGLYLGNHQWAMGTFTPEEALIAVALILSKPAVRAHLEREAGGS